MKKDDRSFLRKLWDGWMTFAKVLGNINSRIILTVFYFVVVGLVSLLVGRWQNYLKGRCPSKSNWLPVKKEMDLSQAKQQF